MNTCCVSIVIPAYNVASYLAKALDSCIAQTYANIEVIVVDDGSTDFTFSIAQNYSRRDKRIIAIHKNNGGVSSARNIGINKATGQFIIFLDGDDWLAPTAVEYLLNIAVDYPDTLVISEILICLEDNNGIRCYNPSPLCPLKTVSRYEALTTIGTRRYKIHNLHGNIYCREIIEKNNLNFDETVAYGEDGLFTYYYLQCVDYCVYVNENPVWYVLRRGGSATRSGFNTKELTALYAVEKMKSICKDDYLQNVLSNYMLMRAFGVFSDAIKDLNAHRSDAFTALEFIKKEKKHLYYARKYPDRYILYYSASFLPFTVYCKLVNCQLKIKSIVKSLLVHINII